MEASHMKVFAKDNPWEAVHLAGTLFVIIGYFCYFAAYLLPTPQWGRDLMTWAMPTVKRLTTAARAGAIEGTDPFPAQVVILYCAWGSILLTMWHVYVGTCKARLQREILGSYRKVQHKKPSRRLGNFLLGVVLLLLRVLLLLSAIVVLYMVFWSSVSNYIGREDIRLYASSIDAISFLLFVVVMTSLTVAVSLPTFYRSLFDKSRTLAFECWQMVASCMKTFVKAFAKDNPWRPLHLAGVLFLITGYFLYFAAYVLLTPQWGRDLMAWAMPTVGGLYSAARVGAIEGTDPFPAQVVILYCAWGSILLTMWYVYAGTCNARLQHEISCKYRKVLHDKPASGLGVFSPYVPMLFATIFCFYVFFWFPVSNLVQQNFTFHSSSISSISILLFFAACMPGVVVVSAPIKVFAKDNPWRPVNLACALFLMTGYFFYFAAYLLPTPQWGRDLMTWAMPMVKSLDLAARFGAIKGTDPFPAQVVILYGAWGSILLTMWCVYAGTCNARLQREILCYYRKLSDEKRLSRLRVFLMGVFTLFVAIFCLYVLFWCSTSYDFGWGGIEFYASSIYSVSFLLFIATGMPEVVVITPSMFYLSLFGNTSSEEN